MKTILAVLLSAFVAVGCAAQGIVYSPFTTNFPVTFSGTLTGGTFVGTFDGNGAGLTNVGAGSFIATQNGTGTNTSLLTPNTTNLTENVLLTVTGQEIITNSTSGKSSLIVNSGSNNTAIVQYNLNGVTVAGVNSNGTLVANMGTPANTTIHAAGILTNGVNFFTSNEVAFVNNGKTIAEATNGTFDVYAGLTSAIITNATRLNAVSVYSQSAPAAVRIRLLTTDTILNDSSGTGSELNLGNGGNGQAVLFGQNAGIYGTDQSSGVISSNALVTVTTNFAINATSTFQGLATFNAPILSTGITNNGQFTNSGASSFGAASTFYGVETNIGSMYAQMGTSGQKCMVIGGVYTNWIGPIANVGPAETALITNNTSLFPAGLFQNNGDTVHIHYRETPIGSGGTTNQMYLGGSGSPVFTPAVNATGNGTPMDVDWYVMQTNANTLYISYSENGSAFVTRSANYAFGNGTNIQCGITVKNPSGTSATNDFGFFQYQPAFH
jgi:hypothetical protein